MIAIGRYLLLIISLSGITLTVDARFSEEDIAQFLDYIFKLHNGARYKHNVRRLERTQELDSVAQQTMNEFNNRYIFEELYGINHNSMDFNHNTKLDGEEAKKFFSLWYEQGIFYNYEVDPADKDDAAGFTQIVWKDTKRIGLTFRCEENKYMVLAVYDPPGNYFARFTINVQRPLRNRRIRDPENNHLYYQTGIEKFFDNILDLHNQARIKHGVGELIRDDELDVEADSILQRRAFKQKRYGLNNLTFGIDHYAKLGDKAIANQVFSEWYNGHRYYTYKEEPQYLSSESFTQIVWLKTEKIGMSIIKNNFRNIQFIVIYDPPGNIPGEFASNVLPPGNEEQGESSTANR